MTRVTKKNTTLYFHRSLTQIYLSHPASRAQAILTIDHDEAGD